MWIYANRCTLGQVAICYYMALIMPTILLKECLRKSQHATNR